MKLSISSALGTLMDNLGVPFGVPLRSSFPIAVARDLFPAWEKFLETTVVRDILKKYRGELGKYYVAAAFASYISSIDKRAVIRRDLRLQDDSLKLYSVRPSYVRLSSYLSRKRVTHGMRLHSHRFDVTHTNIDFIRALTSPTVTGFLEYKVQGRNTLNALLQGPVPSLFSDVPVELRDTLPNGKPRKVLSTEQQARSSPGWVGLIVEKDMRVDVARAKFNTLLVRYTFYPDCILFYGRRSAGELHRAVIQHTSFEARL